MATAKELWDAADAECKSKLGPGWCAVAGEDGLPYRTPPNNTIHCSSAIIAKEGNVVFKTKKVDPSIKNEETDAKLKIKKALVEIKEMLEDL